MVRKQKRKKKKSLSSAIHSSFGVLVFAVAFTLASAALILMAANNAKNGEDALFTTVQIAAERIEWAVKSFKNSIETLGFAPVLSNETASYDEKKEVLDNHAAQFGFTRCQIINREGYSLSDSIYRGNREYFEASMQGDVYISDPIISRTDGTTTLVVSAPLWDSSREYPIGVVWGSLPPDTMNDLISSFQVSPHAVACIRSRTGAHIATSDITMTQLSHSRILNTQTTASAAKLEALEKRMLSGESGRTIFYYNDAYQIFAWAPISNTPEWILVLQTPLSDFMNTFWLLAGITLIISISTIFATRVIARKLSRKAGRPIHILADQLNRAALGDLNFDIEEIGETEDVQLIAEASKNLVLRLTNTIGYLNNYKNNTCLSDFVDPSVINQLTSFYEQGIFRGFHLIIIDNKGTVLAGQRWMSEPNSFMNHSEFELSEEVASSVSSLVIDGRVYGSVGYHLEKDTPITPERADGIRDMVAHVLTLIGQSAYNRNIRIITRIKTLQDNIQNLVEMESSTAIYLEQLAYNLKEIRQTHDVLRRISLFKEMESLTDSALVSITRAVDYSTLNDLNTSTEEMPYTPAQLAQQITIDSEDTGLVRKASISVDLADDLPSILYGDLPNISRVIIRIISDICAMDHRSFITVSITANHHSYATDLRFTVSNPNYLLSSSQIKRCNAYLDGDIMALGTQTDMSNASLRFISIVRLVRLINGSLRLTTSLQQGTAYVFTLPQVALDKDDK